MKRMSGILAAYVDKKKGIPQAELDSRKEIIQALRDSFKILEFEYEDQTYRFENGIGLHNDASKPISINDINTNMTVAADNTNNNF